MRRRVFLIWVIKSATGELANASSEYAVAEEAAGACVYSSMD